MSAALERVISEQQAKIDAQKRTIDHQREDMARLRTTMQQVLADAQAKDELPEWWPMMEAALMGPNVNVTGGQRPAQEE